MRLDAAPLRNSVAWFNVVAVTAAGRVTPPCVVSLGGGGRGWTRTPACLRGHGRFRSSSPHLSSSPAASRCITGAILLPLAGPRRALYVGLRQRCSALRLRYSGPLCNSWLPRANLICACVAANACHAHLVMASCAVRLLHAWASAILYPRNLSSGLVFAFQPGTPVVSVLLPVSNLGYVGWLGTLGRTIPRGGS